MKTTKTLLAVTVLSIGLLNLGSANAAIINIDSGNGSGIGVSLSAGDHVVSMAARTMPGLHGLAVTTG